MRKTGSNSRHRLMAVLLSVAVVFSTVFPAGMVFAGEIPVEEAAEEEMYEAPSEEYDEAESAGDEAELVVGEAESAGDEAEIVAEEAEPADDDAEVVDAEEEVPDGEASYDEEAPDGETSEEADEDLTEGIEEAEEVEGTEEEVPEADLEERVPYVTKGQAGAEEPSVKYKDGEYEGTGMGRNGEIRMKVTIADGKITKIEEIASSEDKSYWDAAVAVADAIVERQTTEVDSVSGATMSSDGIKQAVADALAKAIVPANEQAFESGAGTASNPFVIMTADQLAAFAVSVDEGETYSGQYIMLGGDIDLSGIENWNPIGKEGNPNSNKDSLFDGDFDGNGHTISGLAIAGSYPDWQNAGLFSALNAGASVRNLAITGVNIDLSAEGTTRVGALAGDTVNAGAVIDSVSASGSISVIAANDSMLFVGGLIGRMMRNVVVSNVTTDVNVHAEAQGIGYPSAYAGGIAGMAGNGTAIVNAMSYGDVLSETQQGTTLVGYAGGILGMGPTLLVNAAALGNITYGRSAESQHTWAGAIAGQMTTTTAGASYIYHASDAVMTLEEWSGTDSHTDSPLTGASGSSTKTSSYEIVPTAVPTRDEMLSDSFADTLNANLQASWKLLKEQGLDGTIQLREWAIVDGQIAPLGADWYASTPDSDIFASGEGTEENPYIIDSADQIRAFAASMTPNLDYTGVVIALGADLDVSDADWEPIGGSEYGFNGTFDGQGHVINGLHKGTVDAPAALADGNPYFGLFGVLDKNAVVKNVTLQNVMVNVTYAKSARIGGIAGYTAGDSGSYYGARIDNCHVSGAMTLVQDAGNAFLAGLVGYQYKGAITNSSTDVELSGTVLGEAIAEVGGLVALTNRGLIANCYSMGNVTGSGNRDNGNEGMAAVSPLVAVDAGAVANCYGNGDFTTVEFSVYAGAVSGWITGIGKAYSNWYNGDAVMTVRGENVSPVTAAGTVVPGGVSEEGMEYTGGVIDELNPYTAKTYTSIAEKMNEKFAAFPIDITLYGVGADELTKWVAADGLVTFGTEKATIEYVQPEAEKYVPPVAEMKDGVWYGRDDDKKSVVSIAVENAAITETKVISGESEGDAYNAALERAKEKATYGDFSNYDAPDPSKFAGGSGTKEDPYVIATAEQLRYLAESVNEDNDWNGAYFCQSADIDISAYDWIPIGWALEAEVKNAETLVAAYPFRGSYDGAGFAITGLTIGSAGKPSELLTVGLFGLTSGDYSTNEEPTDETFRVVLNDIHVENASIFAKTRYQNYVGTLVAQGQNGIEIDRSSATGALYAETSDSHARAGGLVASVLRGKITNSWADVDVTAVTDQGRAYAGGFAGMTNRVTVVNSYALGNVTGKASGNNFTYVGGFDGMEGGVHVNCYASGAVTSESTSSGVGTVNGLVGGICINLAQYYNSDAPTTVAGKEIEQKVTGANFSGVTDEGTAKTAAELGSDAFAEELNGNIANMSALMKTVSDDLEGGSHLVYYKGDGSDLLKWVVKDGVVTFGEKTAAEEAEEKAAAEKAAAEKAAAEKAAAEKAAAEKAAAEKAAAEKAAAKKKYQAAVKAAKALKVKGLKVKAQKGKKAKVTWKVNKKASGYQIQYATTKKFKRAKTVNIKKAKTKKRTLKKLKAGKKCFVRIRPYTTVTDPTGKKVKTYGKWTKAKSVKVKK